MLILSTLLNVAYLLPIPIRAFFNQAPEVDSKRGMVEAPLPCLIALVITALGCLVLFTQAGAISALLATVLPTP